MKAKTVLLSLLWVLVVPCLTSDAHAQLGSVRGTVLDEQGNPIVDVTIRIESMTSRQKYRVKTNDEGGYIHGGVRITNRYRVIAEKEGFTSVYAEGIQPQFSGATAGSNRGIADFTMKEGAAGILAFDLTDEDRVRLEAERQEAIKNNEAIEAVRSSVDRGMMAYENGQYAMAVEAFKEGIALDDSLAILWARLGSAYDKLEQPDPAIEAYEKAISLAKGDPDPAIFQNLGGLYSAKGDSGKAREYYEKAAALSAGSDPSGAALSYYNMGVTFINAGQTEEAVEQLTKAVQADPNHAEANFQLGISLLGFPERMDEAIQHMKKYMELKPDGPEAATAQALVEQLTQQ